MLAGKGRAGSDQPRGRALEDHLPTLVTRARPKVDDPVRVSHDGLVMLDDDYRRARVHEPVQEAEELLDVGEMEAGSRLVKNVDIPLLDRKSVV